MILISFFFASLILFMLLAIVMGAPMVPSKRKVAERMVELLSLKKGQTLFDLGSGDGRVLIASARKGLRAVGIEINPYAWIFSWVLILFAGQAKNIKVYWGNYWGKNVGNANGVVVYGLPQIMNRLSLKFQKELKPGTKIVSNSFQIPNLKLLKEETVVGTRIYLYQV